MVAVVRVLSCNEMSTAGFLSRGSSDCHDRTHDGLLSADGLFFGGALSLAQVPLYDGDVLIFDDAQIPHDDVSEVLDGTSQVVGAASSELS